jgi:hypothetical protein
MIMPEASEGFRSTITFRYKIFCFGLLSARIQSKAFTCSIMESWTIVKAGIPPITGRLGIVMENRLNP